MNQWSHFVTRHKKSVLITFFALAVCSGIFSTLVSVNYNMVDYLPQGAQSTTAIHIMEEEFGSEMPNARLLITNITIQEALEYKARIAAIEGINSVNWLDDVVGQDILTTTPVEFLDASILQNYYKDQSALMTVSIASGMEKNTVAAIRDLIGDQNAVAGDAVNKAATQGMASSEVLKALAILLPIIVIILILSTTSWIEPLLFLFSIGIAVMINMGTNIFFGEVSFITYAISPILQLAVSLDYAIFLLHSFNDYRLQHEPQEAMKLAMKKSVSAVAASAATTVIGFLALIFMRFGIGIDLGLNLVKGVLLSFLSVMMFLPALTLLLYKWIDQTRHRQFLSGSHRVEKWLMKMSIPFLILAVLVVVPCFLAQSNTNFTYGMGSVSQATRAGQDAFMIDQRFGKENTLVLLVKKGTVGKETELCAALSKIPHVTSVISYVTAVGAEIPTEYLPEKVIAQFYSKDYARIILYTNMTEEGMEAFQTVKSVLDTAAQHYDVYYLAGQSATLTDMKNVVSTDTKLVNLVAIIGIFFVLLFTFRSITLPLFLLFTIETAIWVNLSFAYFTGQSFNFIGYLVISTVQLGATVDYAILLTVRYLGNRKDLPKKEAMEKTIGDNLTAILVSATVLATTGFTLALTSSNPIVSELGALLGRGTLLSFLMVVCALPALLVLFDKLIEKTTWRSGFHGNHRND
ncbi:MAG TPA: MMPL family transporter [Bacillota bacterium]|nr:MMPL family transporter [Bacillota bacterium]